MSASEWPPSNRLGSLCREGTDTQRPCDLGGRDGRDAAQPSHAWASRGGGSREEILLYRPGASAPHQRPDSRLEASSPRGSRFLLLSAPQAVAMVAWWPRETDGACPLIARKGPTLISPEVLLSRAGCTGDASSHPIPSGPGERTWLRPTAGLAPGGTRGAGRAHCLALTPQVHHGDAWPCSGSGRGRPGRCSAMTGAGGAGEAWREVGVGEERQASLGSRKSQQRLACRGRRGPSLRGCVVGRAGPGCHVGSPAARYPQQQEREPPVRTRTSGSDSCGIWFCDKHLCPRTAGGDRAAAFGHQRVCIPKRQPVRLRNPPSPRRRAGARFSWPVVSVSRQLGLQNGAPVGAWPAARCGQRTRAGRVPSRSWGPGGG